MKGVSLLLQGRFAHLRELGSVVAKEGRPLVGSSPPAVAERKVAGEFSRLLEVHSQALRNPMELELRRPELIFQGSREA